LKVCAAFRASAVGAGLVCENPRPPAAITPAAHKLQVRTARQDKRICPSGWKSYTVKLSDLSDRREIGEKAPVESETLRNSVMLSEG